MRLPVVAALLLTTLLPAEEPAGSRAPTAAFADRLDAATRKKHLARDLPVPKQGWIDYSYWHHGTMALFHFDGPESGRPQETWRPWNQAVPAALVRTQESKEMGCQEGSWLANDRWSDEGGRVYTTALGALTLEVYYRYDPRKPRAK